MREARPYYKKSHQAWYVNLRGKTVRLSTDKNEALAKYHKLLAGQIANHELTGGKAKVVHLLEQYLEWTATHREKSTYARYEYCLRSFAKHLVETGNTKLLILDLKPYHVTRWLDKRHPGAKSSTRGGMTNALRRPLNWAVDEGYIESHPLARMKVPGKTTRGDESHVSTEQWETLLAAINSNRNKVHRQVFFDYVVTLKETGCRPQEVRIVESRHVDLAAGVWRFPASESKGKRIPRTVALTPPVVEICTRLVKRYPTGPIFRNGRGTPWNKEAVGDRFQALGRKIGFRVQAYHFRHTFATNKIIEGVDLITLQHLMGHTDLNMLSRVYQHIQRAKAIEGHAKGQGGKAA